MEWLFANFARQPLWVAIAPASNMSSLGIACEERQHCAIIV